jgi:hypothetical protein
MSAAGEVGVGGGTRPQKSRRVCPCVCVCVCARARARACVCRRTSVTPDTSGQGGILLILVRRARITSRRACIPARRAVAGRAACFSAAGQWGGGDKNGRDGEDGGWKPLAPCGGGTIAGRCAPCSRNRPTAAAGPAEGDPILAIPAPHRSCQQLVALALSAAADVSGAALV